MKNIKKIEEERDNLIASYSERFNRDYKKKALESNSKTEKENKRRRKNNISKNILFIVFCMLVNFIIFSINKNFNYSHLLAKDFFLIVGLIGSAISMGFILGSIFGEEYLKPNYIIDDLNIDINNALYLHKLVLDANNIKHYYDILIEFLGEDNLNKKLRALMKENEEIGSYNLILRLFDNTIKEEKMRLKGDNMIGQLEKIRKI